MSTEDIREILRELAALKKGQEETHQSQKEARKEISGLRNDVVELTVKVAGDWKTNKVGLLQRMDDTEKWQLESGRVVSEKTDYWKSIKAEIPRALIWIILTIIVTSLMPSFHINSVRPEPDKAQHVLDTTHP